MTSPEHERRIGKYIVGGELGRGGFATVYQAHDTVLRRDVALKLLHPPLLTDPAFVTRFENDARATAQLDHPRIAAIYELGHHEGRMFMAIQLLAGGSLADRIKAQGRLAFPEAVRVIEDVAQALDYAHAAGFIHRDVKPGNILFNRRGDAILTDFGLVKAAESSVIARTTMGGLIGTPAYMAPEIWEGHNDGPGADIYALGCVLFEMLSGELLFTGATPPAVMLAHFQPHRYPERWPEGTPAGIETVIERALARDPAARYFDAEALAADLRALAAPRVPAASPAALADQAAQGQPQAPLNRELGQWRGADLAAPGAGVPDAVPQSADRGLAATEAPALSRPADELDPQRVVTMPAEDQASKLAEPGQAEPVLASANEPQAIPAAAAEVGTPVPATAEPIAPMPGEPAIPRQRAWQPLAAVSAAWIVGWVLGIALAWVLEGTGIAPPTSSIIGWAIGWAGAGLIAGLILRRWAARPGGSQIGILAIGWPLCMTLAFYLATLSFDTQPNGAIVTLAIGAGVAGMIAGAVLQELKPALSSGPVALLALGWGLGWYVVELFAKSSHGSWHYVLSKFSCSCGVRDAFSDVGVLVGTIDVSVGAIVGAVLGMLLVAWALSRAARPLEK